MRIQETDRVLKEAKINRRAAAEPERRSALWTWISGSAVALLAVVGVFVYLRRNS
jgi:hypothetical protein